ncbi:hypothetical protein [Candidatus Hodarchaeum mangrovi]
MKIFRISAYGLTGLMFVLTIFTYNFQQRSTGMLPVITYPFRDYTFICSLLMVIFLGLALGLEIISRRRVKDGK